VPRVAAAPSAGTGQLEVVFRPSLAVHDGRHANNGWLQELPDPATKLTWDNPVLASPATLAAAGLANGDLVRLRYGGRELELPVWALPGHADGSVTLTLGYGRTAAGRVGNGVGFDTYALRTAARPDFDLGVELVPLGRQHPLSSTQDHGSMRGRPIVREVTLAEYRHDEKVVHEMAHVPPLRQLVADHAYDSGYQWGMSIDLNACTGCNACVTACQSENNVPIVGKREVGRGREMHWIRVDRYFVSAPGEEAAAAPGMVFQPVPCMHCENAPCEQVCPVAATVHDAEGLNVMVYNRCIGTRYCSNNCPYKVRRFNFFNFTKDTPETVKLAQNPNVTVRSRGVMEKCTYCTQRINTAKSRAKREQRTLADGELQTACEQACPTGAIVFGNLGDPSSAVMRKKAQPRSYVLLEELNDRPRTSYLARLRNPHPELEA
jgi:molybdopterin-containing oxidoreductase family iron-sulfur binding subunit